MKKIAGMVVLMIVAWSCSKAQLKIQQAKAFYTVATPGMAMADGKGNIIGPKQVIDRFVYLETNYTHKPLVDTVWYNGVLFTAVVTGKEESILTVGTNKNTGKPVTLTRKKGDHLWRIDLQATSDELMPAGTGKKIIIKGRLNKTIFTCKLNSETELSTPDRP